MSWLPLSFGVPAILWGLLALPVIWWLLRLTPPKPQTEVFPPLKILARVMKKEETPHKSPWWLTLLRLVMAALIVLALAEPVFNPRERIPSKGSALALIIDNSWATSSDWDRRVATAERLINDAEKNEIPIVLAFTAETPNAQIGPFNAQEARDRLNAVRPRPIPTNRPDVFASVAEALKDLPGASIALLTDGMAAADDPQAFANLLARQPVNVTWVAPDRLDVVGLTAADNAMDRFTITATRAPAGAVPRFMTAGAFDDKGRRIGDAAITFRLARLSPPAKLWCRSNSATTSPRSLSMEKLMLRVSACWTKPKNADGSDCCLRRQSIRRACCFRRFIISAALWSLSPMSSSRQARI